VYLELVEGSLGKTRLIVQLKVTCCRVEASSAPVEWSKIEKDWIDQNSNHGRYYQAYMSVTDRNTTQVSCIIILLGWTAFAP
jgi:hypothetical protein